jgi:hypothetical protein
MASFEFLAIILTGLGLTASIFYYAMVLRNTQKARQIEMLMFRLKNSDPQWFKAWTSVLNMNYETYDEWQSKYGRQSNPEAYADWIFVATIYNNIGLLLYQNQVDPQVLFQQYTPASIVRIWRKYETVVSARRQVSNTELWKYFEYLYDESTKNEPGLTMPEDY